MSRADKEYLLSVVRTVATIIGVIAALVILVVSL